MKLQFNHSYGVDNRHKNVKSGVDNTSGENFLKTYIGRMREEGWPRGNLT